MSGVRVKEFACKQMSQVSQWSWNFISLFCERFPYHCLLSLITILKLQVLSMAYGTVCVCVHVYVWIYTCTKAPVTPHEVEQFIRETKYIARHIYMYIYTVHVKTFPKLFNTIPFRFTKERTIWNGNVAQRFIPFCLVSFFVSFLFILFGDVQRGEIL